MDHRTHYWACALTCDKEIEDIAAAWNEAGPWQWELRERFFFGSYLNSRPAEGVRVHLHEFFPDSQSLFLYPGPGTVEGFRYDKGFTAQLELQADSSMSKEEIDGVFAQLLTMIGAEHVCTIDPYA